MKLYESILTYLPFLYYFITTITYGSLYHYSPIIVFRPYMILTFFVINTLFFIKTKNKNIIKNVLHYHLWQSVTTSLYGILLNNVHHELFINFHMIENVPNLSISILYISIVIFIWNYMEDIFLLFCTHLIASFFPLKRVWLVNLYMYVLYTTFSIILLFRRCKRSTLMDKNVYKIPVFKYFCYLRVHEYSVLIGFFQLYVDYITSRKLDYYSDDDIDELIKVSREQRSDERNIYIEQNTQIN